MTAVTTELVVDEPKTPTLWAKLGAEAFGTFVLVFAILGSAIFASLLGAQISVAVAGGLALAAGIAAVGGISGGHFNPAVTLGLAVAGKTEWKDVLPYWAAQVIGGLVAALVLFVTVPSGLPTLTGATGNRDFFLSASNGFGENSQIGIASASYTPVEASLLTVAVIEIVATAILVGVILGVISKTGSKAVAPFAIGVVLAVLISVTAFFDNASINPARSTASALFGGDWALKQLWLFWVAPLVGGALAGLFYRAFTPVPAVAELSEDELALLLDDSDAEAAEVADEAAAVAADLADADDEVEIVEVIEVVEVDDDIPDNTVIPEPKKD